MASKHNKVMFLFCSLLAITSFSGVRDVVGTPRGDIEIKLLVERLPCIWREKKRGKELSIMVLTGSKCETFFMRRHAVRKLVN